MAKYLRPRRGTRSNAAAQNIVLKSGEMFMEIPSGTMGKTPGRIILGDGSTAYSSLNYATTSSTAYQPFITDPMLYTPIFKNSTFATSDWTVNAATASINGMGNGSGQVTLPTIIGKIKEALCKHEDSITALNNDLGNISTSIKAFQLLANGSGKSNLTLLEDWSDFHYFLIEYRPINGDNSIWQNFIMPKNNLNHIASVYYSSSYFWCTLFHITPNGILQIIDNWTTGKFDNISLSSTSFEVYVYGILFKAVKQD